MGTRHDPWLRLFQTSGSLCSPHCPLHALAHTVHGESSLNPLGKSYSSLRTNSSLSPGIKPFMTTPVHTFLLFHKCFHCYSQNHTPKERQWKRPPFTICVSKCPPHPFRERPGKTLNYNYERVTCLSLLERRQNKSRS